MVNLGKAYFEIVVGIILAILANVLALVYRTQFYLVFVLGMFIFLEGLVRIVTKKPLLKTKTFFKVYLAFLILGLIADLVFGVWICKLWIYPNYSVYNYFLLYIFIYPLGGMIMVYSFSFLERIFIIKPRERKIDYKHSLLISKIMFILGLILVLVIALFINFYKGFFIYTFLAISGIGLVDYIRLKAKGDNLLERFLVKSIKYAVLILAVSYIQGFLHEFPNVPIKEWTYQNYPFSNMNFLGIPITVLFFGWIFLLIAPYAVFELVLVLNKTKDLKNLERKLVKK